MTQDILDDVQQEQVSAEELASPAEEVKETTTAQALRESARTNCPSNDKSS